VIPLSFAQRRLWFVDRFEGPSPTYNSAFALRLEGELDLDALRSAFHDVLDRHEVLRTVIAEDGDGLPHQRVLSLDEAAFQLPLVEAGPEQERTAALQEAATASFDLAADRKREIRVFCQDGAVHAETLIGGFQAYLQRIFITARKSMLYTTADSAELFGVDVATGQPRYEKVRAER